MFRRSFRSLWVALVASCVFGCGGEDFDALLESGESRYSQANEELIIRHFFEDRKGGFFLDVGAFHWKIASTTYYLDEHLGWTGIAVDALPHLVDGYVKNRPRTKFANYFVSDHSGGTETFYRAGPVSSMSKEHVEKLAPGKAQVIEVPTITLDDLLDAHGVEKIDFLSMDIELGEPAALAGFDIERFRPELVCIEAAPSVRDEISAYFEKHGYRRIDAYLAHDIVNWYYTSK